MFLSIFKIPAFFTPKFTIVSHSYLKYVRLLWYNNKNAAKQLRS